VRVLGFILFLSLTPQAFATTVFVAGASGRSGAEVVRVLQDAGYEVRASTRNAERAAARHPFVKTWVEVDAHDTAGLREAVAGAEIVVSALGHGDFVGPAAPQFVGYLGVRNLVDAALATNANHFVLISSSTAGHARGIDAPPPEGWGVKLMPRPEYGRDFIHRTGVALSVLHAIEKPEARGKAAAVIWDKSLPAGEISGSFADIPAENTGLTYSTK